MIIQQTPYAGLWNTFKLMTSLSLNDLETQGDQIGFYPDTSKSVSFAAAASITGSGEANNNINVAAAPAFTVFNQFDSANEGLYRRIQAWNYNPDGLTRVGGAAFSTLLSGTNSTLLWKSYIYNKVNAGGVGGQTGIFQVAINAVVYLKHLHSFFERVPLLKGVFMRMTLNLNQSSFVMTTTGGAAGVMTLNSVNSPLGGVSPLMITSSDSGAQTLTAGVYTASVCVGRNPVLSTQSGIAGLVASPLGGSILLNIPAYQFNPIFESSYLSSPVKKIVYEDIYQYQVLNVVANSTFNNLMRGLLKLVLHQPIMHAFIIIDYTHYQVLMCIVLILLWIVQIMKLRQSLMSLQMQGQSV